MSKKEISRTLAISEKTVGNRLGEIHSEFDIGNRSERSHNMRFVVFESKWGNIDNSRYNIRHHSKTPAFKTINGKKYQRDEYQGRHQYPTVRYVKAI
jgi:hypothetical protein